MQFSAELSDSPFFGNAPRFFARSTLFQGYIAGRTKIPKFLSGFEDVRSIDEYLEAG